jgi:cell division protein FtsI/penicillin-binding protein 2
MRLPNTGTKTRGKWIFLAFGVIIGVAGLRSIARSQLDPATNADHDILTELGTKLGVKRAPVTKELLAQALAEPTSSDEFPTEVSLPSPEDENESIKAVVEYTFDSKIQDEVEHIYNRMGPDYGAFVALDATTGRILSMVSYAKSAKVRENLTLRATFPSASVFKVVTAAAAIAEKNLTANTVIPFSGRNHTLYRRNIFHTTANRWTRYATLKEAFAKSINTVFGKIGAYKLQPEILRDYAARFGFNRKIASDVPMQPGRAPIPDDPWGVAEAASGYTRENTMSPLQGALIAATIVNDGVMMEPYLVKSVYEPDGTKLYSAEPTVSREVTNVATAREIRALMRETVRSGTCRKVFRGFSRGQCSFVDVGGKTGTLTGLDPVGRYDWFVGFAEYGGQKLAFASLTINEKVWHIKSSMVARKVIETYFKGKRALRQDVVSNAQNPKNL